MSKYLQGLDRVLSNLKKETDKIPGKTLKGLIRAAIIVRRDMEQTEPKIPVDTGNLRSSYFLVTSNGDALDGQNPGIPKQAVPGPYVALGFSANYAVKVHEAVNIKFKRPGSGAKFLESALDRNAKTIIDLIKQEAIIK
jgi:hypothetical protein